MKRDLDVIKKILTATEQLGLGDLLSQLDGVEYDSFAYHVSLLNDAGFLKGRVTPTQGGRALAVTVSSLTWQGHDLLDSLRKDT